MAPKLQLSGILPAMLTPFTADGASINTAALAAQTDRLIDAGVGGLIPGGSTGEFTRFTVEERIRIMEIICHQVRGRVPVLAGAAEANVKETVRACEAYYEMGATAVAIVAPYYYKLSPRSVYAYFKEIADNTPIDYLDFASPVSGLGGKMGLDATNKWPGETSREWGRTIDMEPGVQQRMDALFEQLMARR